MHFYDIEGFHEAAKRSWTRFTEHYLKACAENDVVFSIAMGNAEGEESIYGGSTPRVPDLLKQNLTIRNITSLGL